MLRFRKPPRSIVAFLVGIVGIGVLTGHEIDATGVALFCFFIASIDPKPAWVFWYGNSASVQRRPRKFGSSPTSGTERRRKLSAELL